MKNQQSMSVVELIGFIITMLAMVYIYIKKVIDKRRQRLHPEEYAREQKEEERLLRKYMGWDDEEDDDEDAELIEQENLQKQVMDRLQKHQQASKKQQGKKNKTQAPKRDPKRENVMLPKLPQQNAAMVRLKHFSAQATAQHYNKQKVKNSRAKTLVDRTSLRRAMLIKQILGPPVGSQRLIKD